MLYTNFTATKIAFKWILLCLNCRYFEIKPEAQKLFPAFANVPLKDLPKNYAFLAAVNTCFANVHYLIEKAGRNPRDCPVFSKVVAKYDARDVKVNFLLLL